MARHLGATSALLAFSAMGFCVAASAEARPAACVSDDELERVVGPQLRAGAFAVRTEGLGDRPSCSGLPIAQAIQRLRVRLDAADERQGAVEPTTARRSSSIGSLSAKTPAAASPTGAGLPDITRALAFEKPAECASRALSEFFDKAEGSGSGLLDPLGRVAVSRSRPTAAGAVTRRANMRARWNGLTVVALEYVTAPDSELTEVRTYRLVFAEPGSISGPLLARMGFGVSRVGQTREVYDENTMMNPYYISLEARGGGSALTCS